MPGIIESFEPSNQTCTVQPAIRRVLRTEDGTETTVTQVNLPILINVPVCTYEAAGFSVTLPIEKGDECLIVFSERCIDGWYDRGAVAPPITYRMHDLSDAFVVVGPASKDKKIESYDATNAQFRDRLGTTAMTVKNGGVIDIDAVTEINLTAPTININGTIEVNIEAGVTLNEEAGVTMNVDAPTINEEATILKKFDAPIYNATVSGLYTLIGNMVHTGTLTRTGVTAITGATTIVGAFAAVGPFASTVSGGGQATFSSSIYTSGNFNATGNVNCVNVSATGSIAATGNIQSVSGLIIQQATSTILGTHVHPGVEPGSGTTGTPI